MIRLGWCALMGIKEVIQSKIDAHGVEYVLKADINRVLLEGGKDADIVIRSSVDLTAYENVEWDDVYQILLKWKKEGIAVVIANPEAVEPSAPVLRMCKMFTGEKIWWKRPDDT